MNKAPVALFVYNRPLHTQQTVEALLKNELASESDLFIFSDAPKTAETAPAVLEVREYIKTISGFKSVTIIEREENLGLAKSIIGGVTKLCDEYGQIIVLEDDIVTSPFFLRFMNDALDLYNHDEKVVSISGYMFPVVGELPETFFLRGASSWGWATWSRAWRLFEADGLLLLDELRSRKITHQFDLDGSCRYTKMLENQIAGKNYSWAIRWRASVFLVNGLTLYPGRSLVRNIGHDGSGMHCRDSIKFEVEIATIQTNLLRIPQEECSEVLAALILYYRAQRSFVNRVFRRFHRILKKWW